MNFGGTELNEVLRRLNHCNSCEQAADLLYSTFASPSIFVFGELLGAPIINDVSGLILIQLANDPSFVAYYRTLCLFATGKWSEYEADKTMFIELSESQAFKLRQLTILSIVQSNRVVSYAAMVSALGLESENAKLENARSTRLLEDLIIDGVSRELFDGKLDGQTENFYAHRVSARDVPRSLGHYNGEDSIISLSSALSRWSQRAQEAVQMLDQHIHHLREDNTARQQDKTANHDAMVRALTQARSSADTRLPSHLKDTSEKQMPSANQQSTSRRPKRSRA